MMLKSQVYYLQWQRISQLDVAQAVNTWDWGSYVDATALFSVYRDR